MPLRRVEVTAADGYVYAMQEIAEEFEALDFYVGAAGEDGRRIYSLLVGKGDRQGLLDAVQSALGGNDDARIVIFAAEATIPPENEEQESEEQKAERQRQALTATREELYNSVATGADLDRTYLWQTAFSTIVAAIGLIENNIAVVIGAMVIAPLLGPNLAFSFGVALGDRRLMLRALATGLAGIATAALLGAALGFIGHLPLTAPELIARTQVGLDGIALALASGAAAVLSLTAGLPTTLVGVMVAVALLPPTATAGIMVGGGHWQSALGAGLLLLVNVASVNLAALVVFFIQGIKPRTWLEMRAARQSTLVTAAVWVVLLAVLASIIVLRQPTLSP
jgi:uncharacterized hydrophobic protein (TIGR00341 family)